jgi:FlaA1/EpsC-like NDP-sugar epimerase
MTAELLFELDRILSEPLSRVEDRENSAFDQVLAASEKRLVLFGAGTLGRKALESLRGVGVEPLAFADNSPSKWQTQVEGVPVLSPQDAATRYGSSALFLVTIWSLGHFYSESRAMLERMGCTRVESATSLRWKFASRMLPDYCQELPHKLYQQKAEVEKAASLWADDL